MKYKIKTKKSIIILPLPFVLNKYLYLLKAYKEQGYDAYILSKKNIDCNNLLFEELKSNIFWLPENIFLRFLKIFKLFSKINPKYLEIYDYSLLTFPLTLIFKLFRKHITIVLIGYEIRPNDPTRGSVGTFLWKIKRVFTWLSLFLADLIVVKEYGTFQVLEKRPKLVRKAIFQHNSIPIPNNHEIIPFNRRNNDFLWLNRLYRKRDVRIFIHALEDIEPLLLRKKTEINVKIVGFLVRKQQKFSLDPDFEYELLELIQHHNRKYKIKIKDIDFSGESFEYIKNSRFFIFIHEVIFLNYTLLESMAYGVIPIVSNGEGAEKIISHGENGFIFKSPDELKKILLEIFSMDSEKLEHISMKARQTVLENYSIDKWVKNLEKARQKSSD
ncbi:MAG TPA: glycosyltransferase [Fervidobacterium nodosum]|nr:glycosyltransferase [Fervidobacterium nodosum]